MICRVRSTSRSSPRHQPAIGPRRELPSLESTTVTLGALGGYFTELLDGEVRAAFRSAMERLSTEERSVAGTETIVDTYLNISLPEAAHWHARTMETRAGSNAGRAD